MSSRFRLPHALCVVILAGAVAPTLAVAQDSAPSNRDRLWLTAGLGYGSTRRDTDLPIRAGLAGGVGMTYQPGLVLVTARLSTVWDLVDGDFVADVGLLAGVSTRSHGGHVSIAVGPGLASGDLAVLRSSRSTFSSRLGAAVQIQALAFPFEGVGVGLTAFANVNSRQPFGGIMFSLAFGQVR